MTLYFPPSLRGFSPKRMLFSTWVDHLSFGYDLVEALRPRVIVELGVQAGLSYFCFCQAVKEFALQSSCFAVDTWKGDSHTDPYGEEVFSEVERYNEENYTSFSTLKRMLFEQALLDFADDSIGLLHIDGFHTYEAVKGDFEAWYPKVAPGGIVLFHDVAARIRDFGAWKFWNDTERAYPETFSFHHGFGLGVLRKPGGERSPAPLLEILFSDDRAVQERLRRFYVHASAHQELVRKHSKMDEIREAIRKKQQEQRLAKEAAEPASRDGQ